MKKHDKNFWYIFGLVSILPLIYAFFDVWGFRMWDALGGWETQAYLIAEPFYQSLLWGMAYIPIYAIAIVYYVLRRDKSETLAIFLVPIILLQHGVEDVIFYALRGLNIFGDTLFWLDGNLLPVTLYAKIFTDGVISGTLVIWSAIFGIALSIFVARRLLKE